MARNLYTLFNTGAAAHPHNLAIIYCEDEHCKKKITYSELKEESTKIAKILSKSDETYEPQLSLPQEALTKEQQQQQHEGHDHTVLKLNNPTEGIYNDKNSSCVSGKVYNEFPLHVSGGFKDKQSYISEVLSSKINGKKQTTIIGVLCSTGPVAVACILGILRKNAYFYISPEYTKEELTSLLDRVCPQRILVEEKYFQNVEGIPNAILGSFCLFETRFKLISINCKKQSIFQKNHIMKDLAYVISTSGSTGVPKYVYVPHSSIMPNILDLVTLFGTEQRDSIFCAAPLSFDPSVVDMFMAFKVGANLVMVSPHLLRTPKILLNIMINTKVSILQATPTLMLSFGKERLKESLLAEDSHLKILALGGEVFPKLSLLKQWVNEKCKTRIFNLYGITEVSCWATAAEVLINRTEPVINAELGLQIVADNEKAKNILEGEFREGKYSFSDIAPIGNTLSLTVVRLLNKNEVDVIDGEEGEIYIGGPERMCWVDDGTVHITEEHDNEKTRQVEAVLRQTGDRGVMMKGNIYCSGRFDCQVKRNGQKVSLAEIDKQCRSLEYVDTCHIELLMGNKIVAFVYSSRKTITANDVWQDLRTKLSYWKLPDNIIIVKDIPFNKHGKIDVHQLLSKEYQSSALNFWEYDNSLTKYCEELWKRILGCNIVNPNDNFIKSGGNSLYAVHFTENLKDCIGYEVPKLMDALLNDTFMKTCQVIRKYKYSRKRSENTESLYKTTKKLKNERAQHLNSQSIHTLGYEGDKKIKHSDPESQCKETFQKHKNSLNEQDLLLTDQALALTVVSRRGIQSKESSSFKYDNLPSRIELLWKHNLGKCIDSSPVVIEYNNREIFVLVGSHSYKFVCINVLSGTEKWCLLLGDRVESSPVVSGDGEQVYVGCYDGALYCICIENGQILWKYKTEGEIKSSPVVDDELDLVIFGSHDKKLYCLTRNGELKWKIKPSEGSIFSSPCVNGNCVFVATLDGIVSGVNKLTGDIMWHVSVNKPVFSSITSYSEGIIFGNVCGEIFSYSFSGSRLWKFETKGNVFSSPFVLQLENGLEIIGIGSHDHNVYFFNSCGKKIAQFTGLSAIYATPFLFSLNNPKAFCAVICETSGRLCIVQISFENGGGTTDADSTLVSPDASVETVMETMLNGELFASPVFFRNKLYIGSRDDFIYCFSMCS
nr:beta-alanine-activating enzyme-like [Cherax quadricarinatus]XP_053651773.1 beta-alanine-activating enzyme-like [Cherax quadricarinatus]XP_053651774.1 beta-alanine-activating enzyme-like [Cherax quadricarinatus]XP_053651776.1 beta-alanine-activating enzyme-like [Cherax quadricarinatus]